MTLRVRFLMFSVGALFPYLAYLFPKMAQPETMYPGAVIWTASVYFVWAAYELVNLYLDHKAARK